MATDHFQSLSLELMQLIFHTCTKFSDLVALASSCKTIHSIWLLSAPTIIWKLAPTTLVAFDNALMAARATKIVADAQKNGIEPPHPFPVRELSGNVRKPAPKEMKAVFDLEHLAQCVEQMMFHWKAAGEIIAEETHLPTVLLCGPNFPGQYGERNERIYRGIYNLLLVGAVASRPYNALFFQAVREKRDDFLVRCADGESLTDEDFKYLRRFPVYNYRVEDNSEIGKWKDVEYEALFGELARWLMEDGARRGVLEKEIGPARYPKEVSDDGANFELDPEGGVSFDERQAGSIQEIKMLIGAYEYFYRKFIDDDCVKREWRFNRDLYLQTFRGQREITAVPFGHFQVEEISTPWIVKDSEYGVLFVRPLLAGYIPPLPRRAINIRKILKMVERRDWHYRDSFRPPPIEFDLFLYILKKSLGLKLQNSTFDIEWGYPSYMRSITGGVMFRVTGEYENANLVVY